MTTEQKHGILFLLAVSLALSGCTLIGLGTGALIDSSNSSMEVRPTNEALQISSGNIMLVTTLSGKTLGGEFEGTRSLTNLERDSLYNALPGLTQGRVLPPSVGDTIMIGRRNLLSPDIRGTILAIDRHTISLIDNDADKKTIQIDDVKKVVDAQGLEWTDRKAKDYLISGQVIKLKSAGGMEHIAIAEVKFIETKGARYGMVILGAIGFGVDMYFITNWPFKAH